MFEREQRDFSTIKRWGTLRTIQTQNLAEHSFYVAMYARDMLYWVKSVWRDTIDVGDLLTYAIWHDAGETISGDLPGPWKREIEMLCPTLNPFSAVEYKHIGGRFPNNLWQKPDNQASVELIKIADVVDEVMFLSIEISLGNKAARAVLNQSSFPRLIKRIQESDLFISQDMLQWIKDAAFNHAENPSKFLTR